MESAYRVQAAPLLSAIVDTLKANYEITMPKNHDLIKTGSGRVHAPENADWFYHRVAAILRQVMCKGRVSLKGLAYRFGNRKNRGVRPSKFARSSLFVNESAIKELEKIGFIKFQPEGSILTPAAREVLGELIEKIQAE